MALFLHAIKIFSLSINLFNKESFDKVNRSRDLRRLSIFGEQWLVIFNAIKTEYMIISRQRNRQNHPDLFLNGELSFFILKKKKKKIEYYFIINFINSFLLNSINVIIILNVICIRLFVFRLQLDLSLCFYPKYMIDTCL